MQRKDAKLTVRYLPGTFSLTGGTDTDSFSETRQTFTIDFFDVRSSGFKPEKK